MGIEKNPLGKPCKGCFFLGKNLGNCDYWLIMDKLRPCNPGKECTVKRKDAPPEWIASGRAIWDTKLGKHLYDQGATDAEISKACRVSIAAVTSYRKRNWGKVNHKEGEKHGGVKLGWDAEKGLQLWLSGMSDAKIAEALGATLTAVSNYRKRKWMHLKDQRIRKDRAKWDTEKGFAMYQAGASDAGRPHGRWIEAASFNDGVLNTAYCSECKVYQPAWLWDSHPYCPYCGAKMDKEEEPE